MPKVNQPKYDIPTDLLNLIKANCSVRTIIQYKNGRVWLYCHSHAYDHNGILVDNYLRQLIDQLPTGSLAGHDDNPALFNLRNSHGKQL